MLVHHCTLGSVYKPDLDTPWFNHREGNMGGHAAEPGDPQRERSNPYPVPTPSSQSGWDPQVLYYPTAPVPTSPGVSELPGYQSSSRVSVRARFYLFTNHTDK